jgi:protein SCO1
MLIRHLKIFLTAVLVCGGSLSGVASPSKSTLDVPDTTLLDQNGREVRFKSDVLGEKTVAIQFIFTTCRAICPVMGAAFAKLQDRLGERLGQDISLVSISIDPVTDTPARMKQWGEQFGARTGWNLLTGDKEKVEGLLKALEATNHNAPVVLLGNLRTGEWVRSYDDITAPDKLYTELINLADKPAAPAQKYFGSAVLTDQNGEKLRLYDDLLKGKVVVVNAFFSSCTGVCPTLMLKLSELQAVAGDHLGKDVSFLSISVDPLTDTPAKLKTYAQGLNAKPGWYFLTGDREAVEQALGKFGQYVEAKENHSNLFIMGNDRTGLWKKVLGLAKNEDIAASFRSVLNDENKAKP